MQQYRILESVVEQTFETQVLPVERCDGSRCTKSYILDSDADPVQTFEKQSLSA
jgi:hypothetical protein